MSENRDLKCVLIHDNFQNFKSYNIPKAQLVIADIPYNIGTDFYASRPDWYVDGDNKNGESDKARKAAFNTDFTFNIAEYFHFCNRLLKKEPGTGEKDAPCMIVFCSFQQIPQVITEAEKYGYRLSKWGIKGMTLGVAQQMLPYGITVNAIAPGSTSTNLLGVSDGDSIYTEDNEVSRYAMPDEIATYAKLLMSDAGNMVVGDTIYISGGRGLVSIR